ncbi:lipopolysaccharide biosynthesis protein [Rubripirellula reticaptiva]|uniref:Polysaccharide biosynthesis protein n=1 Tax=Rubripirellula reticaptiva TaxID=2528013 RepID=A0A5C6F8V8_9BACT|nr:lipopolysaccharide biosynthesis protein [Rubripirellula reticaptiva]TWU57828.1 Polysaccharide biosynthesis protein [Rubripirellula reticaptiva]
MKESDVWIFRDSGDLPGSVESAHTHSVPLFLIALSVVGVFLTYAITIVLARHLSPDEFDDYIGAIVTVGLLASIAEAGFGKYALRIVPVYAATQDTALLRGYLRFAMLGAVGLGVVLGVAAAGAELSSLRGSKLTTTLIAIAFLPVFAAAGVVVDLLMSLQLPTVAMILSRVAMPLTTLVLVVISVRFFTVTPLMALLCFSVGSLSCVLLGTAIGKFHLRSYKSSEPPKYCFRPWMIEGVTYLLFSFLIAWLFRSSLFIVHHLPHESNALAMLAPAFETGCLVILLSKSIDKYYQPALAIAMESGDWDGIVRLGRSRFMVLGIGIIAFIIVVLGFGDRILRLYGNQYATSYAELCLIALGSSAWTMFSLAPTFLLFSDQRKSLLVLLSIHAVMMFTLTIVLFSWYGAMGAAIAYTVTISSFATCNSVAAKRHFAWLKRTQSSQSEAMPMLASTEKEPAKVRPSI